MASISPFTIDIPQERLSDLHNRLANARLPDELDEAGWDLGAPVAEVRRLAEYWRDRFDWRAAEAKLNLLPHFRTDIPVAGFGILKIHFIHQKSPIESAIPLLYVHGWPGSFFEGSKIIQALSGDGVSDPAFHVVAISLPNFGFSEGPKKRGFSLEQYAETCQNLMQKLGYSQYVTQGGDWGYYITRTMAVQYPDSVMATHLNLDHGFCPPALYKYPHLTVEKPVMREPEIGSAGSEGWGWFLDESQGYRALQATKPTGTSYGITDSPVALLSWLYEKLHDWSDKYPWSEEEVCSWVSIYWFSTAGPGASVRIYHEATHTWKTENATPLNPVRTPGWIDSAKIGYSHFPLGLPFDPRPWIRKLGPISFGRHHEHGGHFFAWEVPDSFVKDVRDMFRRGADAHGVVPGHTGYIP
ncbi:Alpha/Beta hydrolase protein [Penicillium chermesinum]|uniref:Alpha/Beta hydrolase protein n=1 Tax=Penicillium chermesinum TaxID=63820 RepID=A0A9W9TA97_9EURO|nr:Alpha/Beta hydrolase protein [Penicillium chermesinum]KAJ5215014.1 Alpha/Beta hydrolase protein [Penicillium chermesinum]